MVYSPCVPTHYDSLMFCLISHSVYQQLHSFPTRRSSDLRRGHSRGSGFVTGRHSPAPARPNRGYSVRTVPNITDRKSTRLNSSHLVISYAVFCLKKKKTTLMHYITSSHHNYTIYICYNST